ncbi:hypothetical protein ACFWP7_31715 [Streptomyces sp. NPDC058470]|uniref:hypothetical protein n=1 Tax=Streptomyces sp. NPDC058470 TaxID=3346515 RepID=UPI003657FB9E
MISIIRRSTRRTFEEAVQTAQRVPGLEGELAQQRQENSESEKKHTGLEQLLKERDGQIDELRTQLDALRAAAGHVAARMAAAPSGHGAAGYRAAHAFVAHADQFGLNDTDQGRHVLRAIRELTEPQRVLLLCRYGQPQSAHVTEEAARAKSQQQGAAPDGWSTGEFARARDYLWSTVTVTVDYRTPWITPTPLTGVYVLMSDGLPYGAFSDKEAAIREQDRAGIPRTATSLIRVELETDAAPLEAAHR